MSCSARHGWHNDEELYESVLGEAKKHKRVVNLPVNTLLFAFISRFICNLCVSLTVFCLYSPGGVHAVHQHRRTLRGGHELQSSPTVRLHQAVFGRLLRCKLRCGAAREKKEQTDTALNIRSLRIHLSPFHMLSLQLA